MTKGQAHFDNLLFTNSQTEHSLYALGSQPIATRVSGDPAATNNGLFYIFSDHLGSTSVLATINGTEVPGSRARYYPFGSPRTAPTQTITDRNFTGQKENLELGLIYYNARYYVPTIGKFASPDTLIPDPLNPQQFNRYAYTLNNPVRFTDSSGHCAEFGDDACWTLYDRIVNICPECAEYGLEQYGSPYLQDYLDNLNSGWRPYIHCSGRDGCHTLILTWLDMLTQSGELGRQLAAYFKQQGITVRFTDADFVMLLNYDMAIQISNGYIDDKLNLHGNDAHLLLFAQFGHEITHHQQGYINAVSIQGEYLAYKAQIQLAKDWDSSHTSSASSEKLLMSYFTPFVNWDALAANLDPYSYSDMDFFNNTFLNPLYSATPIFPWPQQILYWLGNLFN